MSAYSSAVLALNPLHYWRMDATSGTTETDLGSNVRDLTYSGSYALNQGPLVPSDPSSNSVAYTSTSATADASTGTTYGASGAYGVVLWFKTSTASQFAFLADFEDFALIVSDSAQNAAGTLLGINFVGIGGVASTTSIPADGQPHMLAAIYNNGTVTILLDNVSILSTTFSASQGAVGSSAGTYLASGYAFLGQVSEVACIPSLTSAQVDTLWSVANETTGTGSASQPAPTTTGTGSVSAGGITGTGSASQAAPTSSASGSEIVSGSGAQSQAAPTSSGTGTEAITGTGSVAQPAPTTAGTGAEIISGNSNQSQPAPTTSGTGSALTGISGSGAASQSAPATTSSGLVIVSPVSGTGSATQRAPSSSGSGTSGSAVVETVKLCLPIATVVSLSLPIAMTQALSLPIATTTTVVVLPPPTPPC